MKKNITVLLLTALIFALASCAKNAEPSLTCAQITESVTENLPDGAPAVTPITDKEMLEDILGYDTSLAADMSVVTQLISVDLFELSVIRPAKGCSDAVKEQLGKRLAFLKEQAAYYPQQVEAASAALTGEYKGCCYLICDKSAQDIEEQLKETIGGTRQ